MKEDSCLHLKKELRSPARIFDISGITGGYIALPH
jgi:hypothetical protein